MCQAKSKGGKRCNGRMNARGEHLPNLAQKETTTSKKSNTEPVDHLQELQAKLASNKPKAVNTSELNSQAATAKTTDYLAADTRLASLRKKYAVSHTLTELGLFTNDRPNLEGGNDTHLAVLVSRYENMMADEDVKDYIALSAARSAEQRKAVEAVLRLRDDARQDFLERLRRLGREDGFNFVFSFLHLIEQEWDARATLRNLQTI